MKTVRLTPKSDLARELPRHPDTRVELTEGSYFLSQPLRPPSGQTLCAAPGAHPVISGGVRLTGWGVENGRWTLPVDFAFTQLFVNGERRPRARLPKTGFFEFESLPDGRTTEWYKGATRAVYAPGDCVRWENLPEVRLVALQAWYDIHLRLAAVDEATRTLTFVKRAFSNLHDETGKNARYYIENAYAALTEPGEWCLTSGKLHYLPRPGETLENTEVIAPRLATLVRLEDCRDVRLENLAFRHADWELPAENTGAVQAAFNVPGAIQLRRATDCVIQGCTISQIASYGIEVQFGSTGNRILDCELHDLGAGGVKINHERPLATRCTEDEAFAGMDVVELGWATPTPTEPIPMKTEVARCRIHDGGKIFHSAVGVWIGDSGFNHVHHNEIFDLYYTGISCGWSWNYAPTRCIGNVIEYNHVYNIGRKLLSDMGAIYLLGYQPGGVVRGNHVHDVSCYGYGGSGIYPDQGSSFLTIEDNVVHHTQTDALSIHYGSGLTVRNNIFALTESSLLGRGREESVLTATVERNTFLGKSPKMLGYFWSNPGTVQFRDNRYWVAGGVPPEFAGMTFAEWQALGQDAGSVIADPGFGESLPAVIERDHAATRPILEPRLELGEPTFPTAADGERLTFMPAAVYVEAGKPQRLTLTLTNRGSIYARGTGEFLTPTGPQSFPYDLAPGAHSVHPIDIVLAPDCESVLVAVRGHDESFPMVGQCLTRRQDLTIQRGVPVEQQVARELRARGRTVGQLQMAVVGDRLALRVQVQDALVQPNPEQPWAGSGLELFCESAQTHHKVQQFFVFPGGAARHDHGNAKIVAEPGIATTHERTADGYRLTALIPLALLGVATDATEFHLEMFLATNVTTGGWRQAKLFGASYGWMGMDGWGTVRII